MWMGQSEQEVTPPVCWPEASPEAAYSAWMWTRRRSNWPARTSLPSGSALG